MIHEGRLESRICGGKILFVDGRGRAMPAVRREQGDRARARGSRAFLAERGLPREPRVQLPALFAYLHLGTLIPQQIFVSHARSPRFALKPEIKIVAWQGGETFEQSLVLLQAELLVGLSDGVRTAHAALVPGSRVDSWIAKGLDAHFLAQPDLLVERGVDTAVILVTVGLLAPDERYECETEEDVANLHGVSSAHQ
jgi:hypothetical protein